MSPFAQTQTFSEVIVCVEHQRGRFETAATNDVIWGLPMKQQAEASEDSFSSEIASGQGTS
jgi:hypothetical protein